MHDMDMYKGREFKDQLKPLDGFPDKEIDKTIPTEAIEKQIKRQQKSVKSVYVAEIGTTFLSVLIAFILFILGIYGVINWIVGA